MRETWAEECARIFAEMDRRKEFVTDVDGYIYWWPDRSPHGHLAAHHLRAIADELDRRNKPWDDIVQADPAISSTPNPEP
jgi:hypothetical protein